MWKKNLLLTAFLIALPLAAHAGPIGHPCEGCDLDSDGFIDSSDNCPPGVNHPLGVFNPGQADGDGDGRGDACDNCLAQPNGPSTFAPNLAVSQCDKDSDGYGNSCDGDLDNNGFVTPLDNPIYVANLMAFIPFPPGDADMDCNGFMTPLDNPFYVAQLMAFLPGPSGWACKGLPPTCPGLP